jgi:predicted dehydrogenase/threonine dehydrogenase-like Zn-dependent dehydrogenase
MKKLLQSLETGDIQILDTPVPAIARNHVLIRAERSLISPGTERMLLEFGKGNLIQKALQQPEKVKDVLNKAKTDGLGATYDAVRSKLSEPISLGYCHAGTVVEVGDGVDGVAIGDRVVSNGNHAEYVLMGKNLVAKIPDNVSPEAACFTPLAAIGLQACRLAKPTLGETFCVIGLGLVGLLTVQLLIAQGCRVIGVDFNPDRLALAKSWGAETINLSAGEDPVNTVMALTGGIGADGVLIAAATKSQDPIRQAAQMSRKRGRIILVGVTGLNLNRADFYEKELSFQVSCSYGPGRYDPSYEDAGQDYPIGFVRWTEQRNFVAILEEMSRGRLDVSALISDQIDIEDAETAYGKIINEGANTLGVLLRYPEQDQGADTPLRRSVPLKGSKKKDPQVATVALIGAGAFGSRVTAPGLQAAGARLKTIVSRNGVSAVTTGQNSGFEAAATDVESALADQDVDTIVIATRHGNHASLTDRALQAGKNVYVEKPLSIDLDGVTRVQDTLADLGDKAPRLMVGFNRRFAPTAIKMRDLLAPIQQPKCLIATINAGRLPSDHWTYDPVQGGGRIIGEACHFIDLLRFFIGSPISQVQATSIGVPDADGHAHDKASLTFNFEDGSIGTVHYFANGPKTLPKERYEAFVGEKYLKLDNFKDLSGLGWSKKVKHKSRQDKGQAAALKAFVEAIQSGRPSPIPSDELIEVSRWSILADQALKNG